MCYQIQEAMDSIILGMIRQIYIKKEAIITPYKAQLSFLLIV